MVNKIKEKIGNNKVLKIVLVSFLAIIVGIGISYAFYAAIIKGNETSTTLQLEAGTLSINYDGGGTIIAKGFLPGDQPFATKTFSLVGNNDSDLYMPYTVSLVVDANTFNSGSLRYSFSGKKSSDNGKIIGNVRNIVTGNVIELGTGYFEPNANDVDHTYTLELYFPDDGTDQSDEMNAIFEAHIKIEGAKITPELPNDDENLYADGTLAGAIVGGPNKTAIKLQPDTVPGFKPATTDEGLIQGEDDFGTTYYFRGAVENNYVSFANMCWRIVRVMGDGNVKVTLNNTGSCGTDGAGLDTGVGAFTVIDTSYYTGSEEKPLFNTTDIYLKLVEFYQGALSADVYTQYIVDSIWCQDFTYATGGSNLYISEERLGNGAPSFICSDSTGSDVNEYRNSLASGNIDKGNKTLDHSIGLLTSDEVLFAGYVQSGASSNNYLFSASYGSIWATMSPGRTEGNTLQVEFVWNDNTGLDCIAYSANESRFGVRPTIVVNGKTSLTYGGDGTINNPYVVGPITV